MEIVELPSVNQTVEIPEPYYVQKAHGNLVKFSKLYEEIESELITVKGFSKGKLLLKGKDFLNEKTAEVEQYFKNNVYTPSTVFASWDPYTKIKKERNRRIGVWKEHLSGCIQRNEADIAVRQEWLNSHTHAVWNERYDEIAELRNENKNYQKDLDLLIKLEGQDIND